MIAAPLPTLAKLRARGASTIAARSLTRAERRVGALLVYPASERPETRGDCSDGLRPCPFVSCAHHLYLDVADRGAIKFNFPDREPEEMAETCSLDVADRGGVTLETVGELIGLTRERVRQLEEGALMQLRAISPERRS